MNVDNYPPKKITLDYEEYLTLQVEYEDISLKLEEYKEKSLVLYYPHMVTITGQRRYETPEKYLAFTKEEFVIEGLKKYKDLYFKLEETKQNIRELQKELSNQRQAIKKLKKRNLWQRIRNYI